MSDNCDAILRRLNEINNRIDSHYEELKELGELVRSFKQGADQDTILGWVANDIAGMGIAGLAVGGAATGAVFSHAKYTGLQTFVGELGTEIVRVENEIIPLRGRLSSVEGQTRSNKVSVDQARLKAERGLRQSLKATTEAGMAHQEARNVASQTRRNTINLRKKANLSFVKEKVKGLGQRISRFNVDLGKLSGRIAKNTKIGRAAMGLGQKAVKLYKKIPGPLRKALSTALKAFSIASSVVDIIAGLASIALIQQLQSQINALRVRINASDRLVDALNARSSRNERQVDINISRVNKEGELRSDLRNWAQREFEKALKGRAALYQEQLKGDAVAFQARKELKTNLEGQVKGVREELRRKLLGVQQKLEQVLGGQKAIQGNINQSVSKINSHTTEEVGKIKPAVVAAIAGIGSVVAASVASGNKGTRAAIQRVGSNIGQQVRGLIPEIRRAPKPAELAAKGAAQEAKRAGTYSRIIEPKVTGTLRQANVIGSKQNVEAANARWERLRNRGKQDKLDNEIGKAQKQIADVAKQQKVAAKAPKVDLGPVNKRLNEVSQKLGPQIKSKTGKNIGISGRLTNIWKTGLVNQVISGLNLMLNLHNAAMLSRNLIESVGDMFSIGIQVFQRIILRQDGDEVKPIDVNQLIGQGFNGIMVDIFGKETWTAIILKWNSINRIITSAANVANSVRNMFDGVAGVVSSTANNVGRIGNALKNNRVVEQGSYAFMPTSNTAATGRIASLNNALNNSAEIPDLVTSIGSEAIGVVDESEELGRNFGNLSNKAEQDKQAKAAQAEAERKASTASDLSALDFLPGFDGDD